VVVPVGVGRVADVGIELGAEDEALAIAGEALLVEVVAVAGDVARREARARALVSGQWGRGGPRSGGAHGLLTQSLQQCLAPSPGAGCRTLLLPGDSLKTSRANFVRGCSGSAGKGIAGLLLRRSAVRPTRGGSLPSRAERKGGRAAGTRAATRSRTASSRSAELQACGDSGALDCGLSRT
jgi:hypothetical protein